MKEGDDNLIRDFKKPNINLRFNLLTVLVYIIGIILIIKLFSLQIVHGAEYREESNTRLTRESTLEAARGSILDRSGTSLVSSTTEFSLEMYKTKVRRPQAAKFPLRTTTWSGTCPLIRPLRGHLPPRGKA